MREKKVLIITYYWPPSGGSGVQRWLKFVKYLPSFGWTPYVFTPENPSFAIKDPSLLKDIPSEAEVIHFPIWEPYEAFFKASSFFSGAKGDTATAFVSGKKKSLFQKISTWVRGNFLIPDPRIFWVKPSVSFLNDFIRANDIKRIITTGPPHSIHLIGYKLKKINPSIVWIADFRDPWSEWGLLDSLMVSKIAKRIHRKLERNVLTTADKVTTITPFYVRKFTTLAQREVKLLTNGFDEDDFKNLQIIRAEKFVIRHVGIVNEKCNPRPFMQALEELINEHDELRSLIRVDFVGEVHPDFRMFVLSSSMLSSITTFTSTVPHAELISFYNTSAMLLLVLTGYKDAAGYMPGKLFEYIATGLPILGVGPSDGDAASLMKECQQAEMVESDNTERIKDFISVEFHQWNSASQVNTDRGSFNKYSRRAITQQLVSMLDQDLLNMTT